MAKKQQSTDNGTNEIIEALGALGAHIDRRFDEQDTKWEKRFDEQDTKWESRWAENQAEHQAIRTEMATKEQIEGLEKMLTEDISTLYKEQNHLKRRVTKLERMHPH